MGCRNRIWFCGLGLMLVGAAVQGQSKNVLLICVDDLRPELKSFGADYIYSPNMDRLAASGRAFTRHYVNAPSCGPSRCTLLTGRYGDPENDALFKRAAQLEDDPERVPPSMPEWFRNNGYTTISVGKVSHHPGGRGGADWDDGLKMEMPGAWDNQIMPVGLWEHPRGAMHGLAHGETRVKPHEMDVMQSVEGADDIYPDGLITRAALAQLNTLSKQKKPFFLAVGLIRPHLPFGAPKRYMAHYTDVALPPIPHPQKPEGKTTWHESAEFMKYNLWGMDPRSNDTFADDVRRHYAACVSYADAQVGKLIEKLKAAGAYENTVIVLWGDHGWHLGEHAIWGKHSLFEEALRSPLIICAPGMEKAGQQTDAVVESVDLFPTLCELTRLPVPDFGHGVSLMPQLQDPSAQGHVAFAYRKGVDTIRTDRYRLTVHKGNRVELYDHASPEKETLNLARRQAAVVDELRPILEERIRLHAR